MFRKQYEVVV